jgi:phosphoglycolate phosphatase-like HAD superfamily hydrolase
MVACSDDRADFLVDVLPEIVLGVCYTYNRAPSAVIVGDAPFERLSGEPAEPALAVLPAEPAPAAVPTAEPDVAAALLPPLRAGRSAREIISRLFATRLLTP